jgi:predicted RNA-binding Zn-ribbon protein involved in translation (DUF1610 family)
MSVDNPTDQQTRAESDDIYARVLSRNATEVCPFCGNRDWFVVDQPDMATGLVVSPNGARIPTYTLICDNCGFVRQHFRSVVDGSAGKEANKNG